MKNFKYTRNTDLWTFGEKTREKRFPENCFPEKCPRKIARCAFHFAEIFSMNERKFNRSILNRSKYKKIKLCYSYPLKHFSSVTFLRTILIIANIRTPCTQKIFKLLK